MSLLVVVFLTVSLGLFVLAHLVSLLLSGDAVHVRQRIIQEFGATNSTAAQLPLYRNLHEVELRDRGTGRAKTPTQAVTARPQPTRKERLATLLNQAEVPLTVNQLLLGAGGAGIAAGVVAACLGGILLGAAAALVALALPFVLVQVKRRARQDRFLQQLPNAFELMARVIRTGQSVPHALQAVSEAFGDPVGKAFAGCQHQQNLGLRPEVTYHQMAEASGILELRIFVMAMLIQRQTGGNLSDVLERLAGLIRSRLRLRQQVRALTAEGRLQGATLAVLPFLMFGIMMVINREYAKVLLDHVALLVGTVACIILGIVWIRRIVTFTI